MAQNESYRPTLKPSILPASPSFLKNKFSCSIKVLNSFNLSSDILYISIENPPFTLIRDFSFSPKMMLTEDTSLIIT